ncbi:MarR family transcriptional regulator [Catellatospora sp. KI3]|uniref:GbsR/MarR family transcriptional regulator n=1 Tax=Catellatospora sp. KI3 TaxID=3041620 RepID=UPI002482DD2C|nr:MarR family transcriptional regulator [Catellatospora sp. KI3]MDI1461604.1 MarR family transcriptional regulator [Catellatospora sp. KI3]
MAERDEEAVRRFVEHLAMTLSDLGFPRMPARVLGALTCAEDGVMTAAQLGEWLGVSPAAASDAVRYLVQVGLVLREPVPGSRSTRYRSVSNSWYMASVAKGGVYKVVADVMAEGVGAVGADTAAGARLTEMTEFFVFLQDEIAALVAKWQAMRAGTP